MKKPIKQRILERVAHNEAGCWVWTRGKERFGYGKISIGYKTFMAHRVSYEQFVGPIPKGLQLDHVCHNPSCVNPSHLEPVTARENLMRSPTFQAKNAAKTHCPKNHPYHGENLFTRKDGARGCRICMRQNLRNSRAARKLLSRAS